MELTLSPRLRAVADWVPPGCRFADIGTDHAFLPAWLLLTGRISRAIAADLRPGPLERAAETAARFALSGQMELRLSDGLCAFFPREADCIALAGMGGETVRAILAAAPWTRADTLLLLQPQSQLPELRRWLTGNGYRIERERCVYDAGHWYPILQVRGGADTSLWTPATMLAGQPERWVREPQRADYLRALLSQCQRRREGQARAARLDALRLGELDRTISDLKRWIQALEEEEAL